MSLNKRGKTNSGFTIIEVLIVLAIAGLILLIVFLAVPALQRNSRNTQRRNDVANYLSAVNEWTNNNNGQVPSTAAHLTGTNGVNSLAKLGTLTAPTAVQTPNRTNLIPVDQMELVRGAKCSTTTTGDAIGGPARSIAVRFSVESSTGTPIPQCQES